MRPDEKWKVAWHCIARYLDVKALEALRNGLESDDPAFCQNAVTEPEYFLDEDEDESQYDTPIQKADVVAYALWRGHDMRCAGDIHAIYHTILRMAEEDLPKVDHVRLYHFFGWYKRTSWVNVRKQLLPEVEKAILRKQRLYRKRR